MTIVENNIPYTGDCICPDTWIDHQIFNLKLLILAL